MRWIDIILPEPNNHQKLDTLLAEAVEKLALLQEIQKRDGLDNVSVVQHMALVGGALFQAVTEVEPQAFHASEDKPCFQLPDLGDAQHDDLVGYHLVLDAQWTKLPWNWLHNGIEFLLAKHPIVTSDRTAHIPQDQQLRPWMQRCQRAAFLVADDGESTLAGTLDQLRPDELASPEFLFVPGHTDDKIRRMIYREAEAIEGAITGTILNDPLAKFKIPNAPITPGELGSLCLGYQALHFAGPVSYPAVGEKDQQPDWMDTIVQEALAPTESELEDAMGMEGEVLGVDPITSLLDDVSHRYEETQMAGGFTQEKHNTSGESGSSSSGPSGMESSASPHSGSSPWLLDDGPVGPESLGIFGVMPPLVYSNSYCALPQLGQRFIAAGASTFIGPVVPLFSRPARIFSGYCYQALGDGWCAGAAVWKAAQNCQKELGKDHPAWLSYGVHGYGSLALQYL